MALGNNNLRFTECSSILSLLQHWEALDRQAILSSERLNLDATEIRLMLDRVSDRVRNGTWHQTCWNIFDILGRVRLEDAHSDALACLFRPWEAHGLGTQLLQDFVKVATTESLPNTRVNEVETRKTIGRDGWKIDIEVQGDGWIVAIENKIDHSEGPEQTERYASHYRRLRDSGIKVFCVFLTLDGGAANEKDFQAF